MGKKTDIASATEFIKSRDNILIICHAKPDGDTLGCAAALRAGFPEKNITVGCNDDIPPRYLFLFENTGLPKRAREIKAEEYDTVISVDVADAGLSEGFEDILRSRCDLKIDHHATGTEYAERNLIDSEAAAAGEIIYKILKSEGRIDSVVASALYTAVSTDTGCFKFTNTTSETLEIAADLLKLGADNRKLNNILFESKTLGETAATKAAYASLKYYCGGKVATVILDNEMKKEYGFTDGDTSEVSGLSRAIEGVSVGVTVKQDGDNPEEYKISVRSDGSVDASAICREFGGGGHIGAAGCRITAGSPAEAEEKVLEAVLRAPGVKND